MTEETQTTEAPKPQESFATTDDAYEAFQEMKEERAEQAEPEESPVAVEPAQPKETTPQSAALWTNEEASLLATFQQEAQSFQQDLEALNQFKQKTDLNELAKRDKAEATAVRMQIAAAEKELAERYEVLSQNAEHFNGKLTKQQQETVQKHLEAEKEKLSKALPNVDRPALRKYLVGSGFSESEVAQAYDHRLVVLAEKARRYDEMSTGNKRVPKMRARPKPKQDNRPPQVAKAWDRFNQTGRLDDAVAILTAERETRR